MWYEASIIQEIMVVLTNENIGKGRNTLWGSEDKIIVPVVRKKRSKNHQRIECQSKTADAKDKQKAIGRFGFHLLKCLNCIRLLLLNAHPGMNRRIPRSP